MMDPLERADRIVMAAERTRIANGMTMNELADMAKVPVSSLKKWMAGANKPGLYQMCRVLDALGFELVVRRKV